MEGALFFLGALAIRLLHLHSISALPSFYFPYEGLDGALYVRLGEMIRSGEPAPQGLLHAAPLYAYWLAAFFQVFGDSLLFPRLAQAALGAGTTFLLWRAARQIGGKGAGRLAGTVAALYPPFLLFEGTLQSAALVPFLFTLILTSLLRAQSTRSLLACGLILGLSTLNRPDALPLFLLLPIGLLLGGRRPRQCAIVLVGAIIPLLPFTLISSYRAGGFVPVSAHGGIHLYIGNHDGADGYLSPTAGIEPTPRGFALDAKRLAESSEGRQLSAAEISRYWSDRAIKWIVSNPGSFTALTAKKFRLFWNDYEIPNNEDLYFMSRFSPRLPGPLPLFGLIAPFALFALLFAPLSARVRGVTLPFILNGLAGAMIFFVTARYRLPTLPALILLAPLGAAALWDQLRKRDFVRPLLLLPLLLLCNLPVARFDFAAPESRMGNSHMQAGNVLEAEEAFRRALEIREGFPEALAGLAELYRRNNRHEEALALYARLQNHPTAGRGARNDHATLLAERGDIMGAVAILQKMLVEDPEDDTALANLAACQMQSGMNDRAEPLLRDALRINPENENALFNLALVRAQRGDRAEGEELLVRLLALSPRSPRALFNAGIFRALRGDHRGALVYWERLQQIDAEYPALTEHIERARSLIGESRNTP